MTNVELEQLHKDVKNLIYQMLSTAVDAINKKIEEFNKGFAELETRIEKLEKGKDEKEDISLVEPDTA